MSHFAVMVLGQNVEQQLAPYHEFECTGTVNEYVQTIDRLPSLLEDYAKDTRTMLRGPEGELVSAYDGRFYREQTEEEKKGKTPLDASSKIRFVPKGWTEQEVVVNEFMTLIDLIKYETGDDFPILQEGDEPDLLEEHKWGWARVNAAGEVIEYTDRTNPNKQWDWYQVGGRWSGLLKLKETTIGLNVVRDENQPAGHQVGIEVGPVRRDGELYVDQALKRDIDMEGMRNEAGIEAAAKWDKAAEAKIAAGFAADTTWDAWSVVFERHPDNVEAAREEYHAQGAMKAVKEALKLWRGADEFLVCRDEFIQQARDSALVLFGVVQDSKWFAKGEMGWFGMSTDDMTQAEWNQKVNELLDGLPDDTLITIVDCHI